MEEEDRKAFWYEANYDFKKLRPILYAIAGFVFAVMIFGSPNPLSSALMIAITCLVTWSLLHFVPDLAHRGRHAVAYFRDLHRFHNELEANPTVQELAKTADAQIDGRAVLSSTEAEQFQDIWRNFK